MAACLAPSFSVAREAAAETLGSALLDFAQVSHIELVIEDRAAQTLRVTPLRGYYAPAEGLGRLLAGTGLSFRRTLDGIYIVYRREGEEDAAGGPVTLPELIVSGRRTQNIDLRRTQNDILAYQVLSAVDIEDAQRGDVEDILRARLPANAETQSLSQSVVGLVGSARSGIDLRGLGALNTLVLVDGRRLPSIPTLYPDNDQPDLNGIPLSAIERIETLGGTAGGIFGPGALGGVVNIILKRDYDGADLQLRGGTSSRGDASHIETVGHLGFSPNDGRTQVSLTFAAQSNQPLLAGDRGYALAARTLELRNDPVDYLTLSNTSNAVTVLSNGGDLTLKPQFGGESLKATTTFLPIGFSGSLTDASAVLKANAGQLPLDLADDNTGARGYLATNRSAASAIASARHQLLESVEVYVDALAYRTDGHFVSGQSSFPLSLSARAPTNPFVQSVNVSFPFPMGIADTRERADTLRVVTGAVVKLSHAWTLTADVALGSATVVERQHGVAANPAFGATLFRGVQSGDFVAASPFGPWHQVLAAEAQALVVTDSVFQQVNHFSDLALRLAGPVATLRGGPATVTALLERRTESVPASTLEENQDGQTFTLAEDGRSQTVQSAYVELRAPFGAPDEHALLLRGVELQLAARYDQTRLRLASANSTPLTRAVRSAAAYTAGFKVYPLPSLMLRASVATGQLPPDFAQLTPQSITLAGSAFPTALTPADPKRGGVAIAADNPVLDVFGGNPDATGQRALTTAIGLVFNPGGQRGPRLSIDYSRITRSHEIVDFPLDETGLLAAETLYPTRVRRDPLTDADRALGYTAGPVTELDLSAADTGQTIAETVDAQLAWPIRLRSGDLRLSASVTWQPRLLHRDLPSQPWVNYVGHIDGPTAWRGVAGVDWTDGGLGLGLSAQFISGYLVTFANPGRAASNAQAVAFQGGAGVPAQVYFDGYFSRRLRIGGVRELNVVLSVQNLFDRRPPILAQPALAPYSTYADPRGRRFDLSLKARF